MTGARITVLGSQERTLKDFLAADPNGHERAAAVLFRRLAAEVPGLEASDRYIAVEVIPFPSAWIVSSSSIHVRFELHHLRELFRRCEDEGLVFGFAHNHPGGYDNFSLQDEENEQTLVTAISNRNGPHVHLVALLLCGGKWLARIRQQGQAAVDVRHMLVIDQRLELHGYATTQAAGAEDVTSRQAAAFGQPFVDMLRSLRIGVVGCSGTGSPTATLLARSGAGELILVDADTLAESNLNRVRGFKHSDIGQPKAPVLHQYIDSLGLPVSVASFESLADTDPPTIDALSTCDVVFGCTDDEPGREALNVACYFYGQAYIDMGLGGLVAADSAGHPHLRNHFGRISVVLPEIGECLFCQEVISERGVRRALARRAEPHLTEEQLVARYLGGGAEPSPGVGPFTSATADFAVATLFDLVRPYRRYPPELRRDLFVLNFVTLEFSSRSSKSDHTCSYCGGRDFLLMASKYRLGRPALGRANVQT